MRKIVNLLVVLSIIGMFGIALIPKSVVAMTGSGTEGDPYMIYDVDDLQDMNLDLDAYYELANDIDASDTVTWNEGAGFLPIGSGSAFMGCLDGNGYVISDLYIERGGYIGLFSTLGDYIYGEDVNISISNLGLVSPFVYSSGSCVGCLAGFAQGTSVLPGNLHISNCWVTNGVATGKQLVGGLIGYLQAGPTIVEYCTFAGAVYEDGGTTIYDGQNFGGLIGRLNYNVVSPNYDVTIYRCATAAYIEVITRNPQGIGGLIGVVSIGSGTTIEECYSLGSISVGTEQGPIKSTGGLVGWLGDHEIVVENCYSRVDVSVYMGDNTYRSGGFVGHIGNGGGNLIENSYSAGAVSGSYVGGLVGSIWAGSGTVASSFWDTETSGQSSSAGGTGKTTAQMKTESTFTSAGWDFDDVWAMGTYNDGYPYLRWDGPFPWEDYDFYQVVWFQPNYIIQGTELPNRTGNIDGVIHWGANPEGITISLGELIPEEEYNFEPIIPSGQDIIKPEPEIMTGDVDTERLHDNPLYPLVQVLTIPGFLTERLVWLGLAWFIVIAAMFGVHLGFDTHKDTEKPQHFVLTTITGLGLSILFYTMGIFPFWVIILMAFGLIGAIIWERQPVL